MTIPIDCESRNVLSLGHYDEPTGIGGGFGRHQMFAPGARMGAPLIACPLARLGLGVRTKTEATKRSCGVGSVGRGRDIDKLKE